VYIELHAASAFSFLQGASLPEALVARAAALGYPAVALLDADGLYGAPRLYKAAKNAGLRAIVGAELTIDPYPGVWTGDASAPPPSLRASLRAARTAADLRARWRLPVLVESQEGYRNLCRLITRMKLRSAKGEGALHLDELDGHLRGLVAIGGRPLLETRHAAPGELLDRLVGLFGRGHVCVELQRHCLRDEEADNAALSAMARAYDVPVIATNDVRFAAPTDRPLFDVLTCVRHHTTVDAAGRLLARNAERYLKSPQAMAALFADRRDALAASEALAERLEFTMADLGYRFPRYPVPEGETEASFLRRLVQAASEERYRGGPHEARARAQIERELTLIEKLKLDGYFLIVWDIVNFCRRERILVQGRGSAANSAVCYTLGITAVDPIAMELLFERFLSEERGEWPDIDLDLPSGDRRERVIQYVYEKYGRLGAAMTANVITYRGRSAARDVGKALALDAEQIDRLAKVMHRFEFTDPSETLERDMAAAGLSPASPRLRTFAGLWRSMQDLPRHIGQHSGGMVICQGALDAVVPLEPASMPGRVVVQWDKDDCADMGIVKVDLLGLGMMAVLEDAITLINHPSSSTAPAPGTPPFELGRIPPDDPAVYDLLQKADTVGVFQVESRAQMATLPRMKPEKFYDLVVEVALIRPGPIVGNMVHPYLARRAGREAHTPLHPLLEPVLKRTLGVPLFQEQLLRMAMVVAGFTGGQAEELRRAMGFKRSEQRMQQIEVALRAGMAARGITGEVADRIVLSITSFALYGFPESHAASFALLAYASAYLKVHHTAVFYTALLNNQPMGFYHPASLVKDAQRRGVTFHPIDVQQSDWDCRIEADGGIRLGFRYVTGLRKEMGETMAAFDRTRVEAPMVLCATCGSDDESMIEVTGETRTPEGGHRSYFCNTCAQQWRVALTPVGRFASIDQLVQRTGLHRDEVTTLADIGALSAFSADRRSALWQVERAVRPGGALFGQADAAGASTDEPDWRRADRVAERSPLRPMTPDERLRADYGGMGLTVGPHPMELRRAALASRGVLPATALVPALDGRQVRVAGMVIARQRPGTAKGFVFLMLEDETGIANVIVRPDLFDRQREAVIGHPFLVVDGVLQHKEGVASVRAERLRPMSGGAAVSSHDFH